MNSTSIHERARAFAYLCVHVSIDELSAHTRQVDREEAAANVEAEAQEVAKVVATRRTPSSQGTNGQDAQS